MGPRLRELRLRAGLSQRQLAQALDVRTATIANWERARREFSFQTAARLRKALGCTWEELAGEEPIRPPDRRRAP